MMLQGEGKGRGCNRAGGSTMRGIDGINAVREQGTSVITLENYMGNEGFFYLYRQLWLFR